MENNVVVQSITGKVDLNKLLVDLQADYNRYRRGELSRGDVLTGVAVVTATIRGCEYLDKCGRIDDDDDSAITDITKRLE